MTRIVHFFERSSVAWLSAGWLAAVLAAHAWPATWWLEPRKVHLADAKAGEPVAMLVDRSVHRRVQGQWTVTVKRWGGVGWVPVCTGSGSAHYRSDNQLPEPLLLAWWTDGRCITLPEGRYILTTSWRLDPGPLWPDKMLSIDSNVFEVKF